MVDFVVVLLIIILICLLEVKVRNDFKVNNIVNILRKFMCFVVFLVVYSFLVEELLVVVF